MENSYRNPVAERIREEWKHREYVCEKCGGLFTSGEPCPEHWTEIRKERMAIVIERQKKVDDDFANADNPKKDPYNLWKIAERLTYIEHVRKI